MADLQMGRGYYGSNYDLESAAKTFLEAEEVPILINRYRLGIGCSLPPSGRLAGFYQKLTTLLVWKSQ